MRDQTLHRVLVSCITAWATVATVACGTGGDALADIRARGFLRAGYSEEPPYAFLNDSGEVVGESPGALRGALRELEIDSVRWIRFDFRDLLPALLAGRVDVVASGLLVTPTRTELVDFSRPTTCVQPTLVTAVGAPPVSGLERFLDPGGGLLAVLAGSVEEEAASVLGIPEARLLAVPDVTTGVAALQSGDARAFALTAPSGRRAAEANGGLRWRPYQPADEIADLVGGCSALAVRKADTSLLNALDRGLDRFVGSEGHLSALAPLGFTAADLPVGSEESIR